MILTTLATLLAFFFLCSLLCYSHFGRRSVFRYTRHCRRTATLQLRYEWKIKTIDRFILIKTDFASVNCLSITLINKSV